MATIRTKTHHLFLHRVWCKIGIMHGNAPRYGWPLPKRTAIFMIRYAQKRTNISKKTLVKKRVAEGATLFGSCVSVWGASLAHRFRCRCLCGIPSSPASLVGMHQNAPTHAPKRTRGRLRWPGAPSSSFSSSSLECYNLWISWGIQCQFKFWVQ